MRNAVPCALKHRYERFELVLDAVVEMSLSASSDLYQHGLRPSKCRLVVSKEFMSRKDSFELLTATLCKLWRFPSFVFSRWAARVNVLGVPSFGQTHA
eukprot:6441647-Amphidinium_carterae.3